MTSKLSKPQQNALEYLQKYGSKEFRRGYGGSDILPYSKLVQFGYASMSPLMKSVNRHYVVYALTEAGQALADKLFGSSAADGSDEITSTPAPGASEPVADTASKAYSARQLQIIQHFQNVYYQFGRNADTYSILVWTSADTDFIYPQEVAELIENGCEYFSVVYPKHTNMWTVPNYQINKAIASYIAPGASGHVISGHGRTSRNRKRSNQGQNQGRKPSKLYPSMNIERNTPEAHKLRQKWALQNKVNIPSAITGAKLLRQAQQLTVVPKPKQMTRILERVA